MNFAKLEVARLTYPFDDPRVAGFAANLGRDGAVHRVAEE